uniref:Ig-like domain-containing protein n=1 Tax=Erpetoichthys calabaricus TaxID=27687 RepID=A0A8C4RRH8_ERPCA
MLFANFIFIEDGITVLQTPPLIFAKMGHTAVIRCEHNDNTYLHMYFYRQLQNEGIRLIVYSFQNFKDRLFLRKETKKNTLEFKSVDTSDSGIYFCAASLHSETISSDSYEAYFGDGTKLTVLVADKSNEFVTLVCLATDFYPDHIELTWEINKKKTTDKAKSDYRAVQSNNKTYSISSRLRVSRNVWCNADNVFTCVAKFYNDTDRVIYVTDHVSGKGKDFKINPIQFTVIMSVIVHIKQHKSIVYIYIYMLSNKRTTRRGATLGASPLTLRFDSREGVQWSVYT